MLIHDLLKRGTTYADLGDAYFDQREREAAQRRLVRRLGSLAYQVALTPRCRPHPQLRHPPPYGRP